MGVWNASTPLGSDNAREGDDRLREMKAALAEALSHEDSTFPGATPASTPIFIPGFLRGATGSRPTGDSLVSGRLYINTTLQIIERYNGASWDSVGNNFAAGTVMLFYQASAPTGWTAVALNDKFLRVVSAGGTGGSSGGSGLSPSSTITLAHTHSTAHTHPIPHQHVSPASGASVTIIGNARTDGSGWQYGTEDIGGAGEQVGEILATGSNTQTVFLKTGGTLTANSGSASSETTNSQLSDTAFQYADIIVATKD
jgi:hypothetical protein